MLDTNLDKAREHKKKYPESSDPTLTYTIKSLIKTIDNKKPDPLKVEQWIKELPMADVNTIIGSVLSESCNKARCYNSYYTITLASN